MSTSTPKPMGRLRFALEVLTMASMMAVAVSFWVLPEAFGDGFFEGLVVMTLAGMVGGRR